MYQLSKEEQKNLDTIKAAPYMYETIKLIEQFAASHTDSNLGYLAVFDEIFTILNSAKSSVDIYLAERKLNGEIKDEK